MRETQQSSLKTDNPKCWHCQGDHLKKICPTTPQQNSSLQPKSCLSTKKQHNLIKSFCKRFQDRKSQVNKVTISSEDDSFNDKLNQFFSEFNNLMTKDDDDTSSWLNGPPADQAIIYEVFIEGFHALYKIQIGKLKTVALFDTGASINTISFKFFSTLQQQLTFIPTNKKAVSTDSDSLGFIGEVHIKFKIRNIVFYDRFIILNNLQHDVILGLPWQWNYRIGCTWNQEGNHLITIKNQFLVLSIAPHILWQLARTKGHVLYNVEQLCGFPYKHHKP